MLYLLLFMFFATGLAFGSGAVTPVVLYIAIPVVCVCALIATCVLASSSKGHYTTEAVLELINKAITYLHEEGKR